MSVSGEVEGAVEESGESEGSSRESIANWPWAVCSERSQEDLKSRDLDSKESRGELNMKASEASMED